MKLQMKYLSCSCNLTIPNTPVHSMWSYGEETHGQQHWISDVQILIKTRSQDRYREDGDLWGITGSLSLPAPHGEQRDFVLRYRCTMGTLWNVAVLLMWGRSMTLTVNSTLVPRKVGTLKVTNVSNDRERERERRYMPVPWVWTSQCIWCAHGRVLINILWHVRVALCASLCACKWQETFTVCISCDCSPHCLFSTLYIRVGSLTRSQSVYLTPHL